MTARLLEPSTKWLMSYEIIPKFGHWYWWCCGTRIYKGKPEKKVFAKSPHYCLLQSEAMAEIRLIQGTDLSTPVAVLKIGEKP